MRVYIETLGCPKNEADSNALASLLRPPFSRTGDPRRADIIVVNTCGFIHDAREESVDTLLEYALWQDRPQPQKVIAWGCLVQRYYHELVREIPEIHGWIGLHPVEMVAELLRQIPDHPNPLVSVPTEPFPLFGNIHPHRPSNIAYWYLKIGDGCDRRCSFCSIPGFKGPHRSRTLESVLQEARYLLAQGIKELILVDQDTTQYDSDTNFLEDLLVQLDQIPGDFWIRVMYLHPDHLRQKLLDTMASLGKVLPYFDIPIQHASDSILKAMNRTKNAGELAELFRRLRERIPNAVLRTTVMVGYPGETQEDFAKLLAFMEQVRFDRLGAFLYSPEENTIAFAQNQASPVPQKTGQRRLEQVMQLQKDISEQTAEQWIGKKMRVLVEEQADGVFIGRSFRDAPEVDASVILSSDRPLHLHEFVECEITASWEYDLEGRVL